MYNVFVDLWTPPGTTSKESFHCITACGIADCLCLLRHCGNRFTRHFRSKKKNVTFFGILSHSFLHVLQRRVCHQKILRSLHKTLNQFVSGCGIHVHVHRAISHTQHDLRECVTHACINHQLNFHGMSAFSHETVTHNYCGYRT